MYVPFGSRSTAGQGEWLQRPQHGHVEVPELVADEARLVSQHVVLDGRSRPPQKIG